MMSPDRARTTMRWGYAPSGAPRSHPLTTSAPIRAQRGDRREPVRHPGGAPDQYELLTELRRRGSCGRGNFLFRARGFRTAEELGALVDTRPAAQDEGDEWLRVGCIEDAAVVRGVASAVPNTSFGRANEVPRELVPRGRAGVQVVDLRSSDRCDATERRGSLLWDGPAPLTALGCGEE